MLNFCICIPNSIISSMFYLLEQILKTKMNYFKCQNIGYHTTFIHSQLYVSTNNFPETNKKNKNNYYYLPTRINFIFSLMKITGKKTQNPSFTSCTLQENPYGLIFFSLLKNLLQLESSSVDGTW